MPQHRYRNKASIVDAAEITVPVVFHTADGVIVGCRYDMIVTDGTGDVRIISRKDFDEKYELSEASAEGVVIRNGQGADIVLTDIAAEEIDTLIDNATAIADLLKMIHEKRNGECKIEFSQCEINQIDSTERVAYS
jgi:hypothetical protein